MRTTHISIAVAVIMIVFLSGCDNVLGGGAGAGDGDGAATPVTGVTVTPDATDFELTGRTVSLTAEVSPADAADTSVTWSSSDESVATVASDGTVTSVGSGTATITATTTDGGLTAEATVTVPHPAVDAARSASFLWMPVGTIWSWGADTDGLLGNGASSTSDVTDPAQIGAGRTWLSIDAGTYHVLATAEDGTLWGWGWNGNGRLGTGDTTARDEPVQIGADTDWRMVDAAGASSNFTFVGAHTLGLKRDGTLWAWGSNSDGQLGDGTTTERLSPTQIGTDSDWVAVAAAWRTSFAIKADGTLYSWGADRDGGGFFEGMLGDGGTLGSGSDVLTPTQVGTDTDWAFISAQNNHVLAIKTDGTLWGWGFNDQYQLGQGASDTANRSAPIQIGTDTDWETVDAGDRRSAGVKTDGTRWVWGLFDSDQYGLGYDNTAANDDIYVPTQAGSETDWRSVTLGRSHGLAVRGQDRVFGWGANGSGQVGTGDTNSPKQAPTEVTVQ